MAEQNLTVRTVKNSDVDDIVRIWNATLHRDIISKTRFINWLFLDLDVDPLEMTGCYVAEKNNRVVGFSRAIVRRVPNDGLGLEEDDGWIPVIIVDPDEQRYGVGSALMETMLAFFRTRQRSRVFFCGNTGSAPGYVFPGVDKEAYPAGMKFLEKWGFVIDHEPVAMARNIVDLDYDTYYRQAWAAGTTEGVTIKELTPDMVLPYLQFMRQWFPGDWNIAARAQIRAGKLDALLIALVDGEIAGYCQWDGEHFGPFGVREGMRGKRIGAKLFVEAMRRIKADDGRTVWFNWADPDAARFYNRFDLHATRHFAIMRLDLK